MVYQIPNNVVDIKVCSISFQRHCTSELNQQKSQRKNNSRRLNFRSNMADNQSKQHQLPVVEIKPFTKKVWRREKSLPDFYEKKNSEDNSSNTTSKGPLLEITPATSRLVRELTETRKSLETRQNTMDSSFGKYRNHPKAEFLHESNKAWRKQDLIPSFITRFERTKTSVDFLSKENSSIQRYSMASNVMWDKNETSTTTFNGIKVKGGKMNQHIHRRHLLYLNPLDSYRQPHSWATHYNSTDNSRNSTGRYHLIPSRNSFPLTSGRARELILAGSQFSHPLKPIQREDAESPHKFNSKLGAAKCSLQVLTKLGAPTKLEKTLEKEFEMNLERFRKDRFYLPHDLKNLPSSNVYVDSNPTIGETFIRNGLEANKAKKRHHQEIGKPLGLVRHDTNGWYPSEKYVFDFQRMDSNYFLNQTKHPIDSVLHEETEFGVCAEYASGTEVSQPTSLPTNLADSTMLARADTCPAPIGDRVLDRLHALPLETRNALEDMDSIINGRAHSDLVINISNADSLNPLQVPLHTSLSELESSRLKTQNGDNHSVYTTPSSNLNSPVDSSRLETNLEYLKNLQRKSRCASSPSQKPSAEKNREGGDQSLPRESNSADAQNGHNLLKELGDIHETNDLNAKRIGTLTSYELDGATSNLKDPANTQTNQIKADINPSKIATERRPSQEANLSNPQTFKNQTKLAEDGMTSGRSSEDSVPSKSVVLTENQISDSPSHKTDGSHASEKPPNSLVFNIDTTGVNDDMQSATVVSRSASDDAGTSQNIVETSGSSVPPDVLPLQGREESSRKETKSPKDLNENSRSDLRVEETKSNSQTIPTTERIDESNLNKFNKALTPETEIELSKHLQHVNGYQTSAPVAEDEGISIATPIEAAVLDSSMTEACSDQEGVMSGCADNGDSGVSTTFITADESRPKELGGLVAFD